MTDTLLSASTLSASTASSILGASELHNALDRLHGIIDRLLGPDGCPWDKEQTPDSLTEYLIEECFELVDAIRSGNASEMRGEMGDVAFLLLFLSRLSADKGGPTLAQALNHNADKMIRRHPHVFAGASFTNQADLLKNWDEIKRGEKAAEAQNSPETCGMHRPKNLEAQEVEGVVSGISGMPVEPVEPVEPGVPGVVDASGIVSDSTGVIANPDTTRPAVQAGGTYDSLPSGLPPLTKAYRIHSKAARIGFTWPDDEDVERQVEAEWLEVLDAFADGEDEAIAHELGDHLFTLVELGRRKGFKAAAVLDAANRRFLGRFAAMEALARSRGLDFINLSLDDKDELWNEVKAAENA